MSGEPLDDVEEVDDDELDELVELDDPDDDDRMPLDAPELVWPLELVCPGSGPEPPVHAAATAATAAAAATNLVPIPRDYHARDASTSTS